MATSEQLGPSALPLSHYDIDRAYFGVTASPGLVGRYLDLSLQICCVPKFRGGEIGHG
jgi:hypothetical protein